MLSDPVAEAFGLIHRHPSGENFWYGPPKFLQDRVQEWLDEVSQIQTRHHMPGNPIDTAV